MQRYILQASEKAGYYVCTDTENLIVCTFLEHNFNNNQKFDLLENFEASNYMNLAKYCREMGDWLRANHYEKVF